MDQITENQIANNGGEGLAQLANERQNDAREARTPLRLVKMKFDTNAKMVRTLTAAVSKGIDKREWTWRDADMSGWASAKGGSNWTGNCCSTDRSGNICWPTCKGPSCPRSRTSTPIGKSAASPTGWRRSRQNWRNSPQPPKRSTPRRKRRAT